MDEGGYKKTEAEPEARPEVEKSTFKSNFKTWMRVVAFVVVAVFLPQQVAQAVEYDWRLLWQKPQAPTTFIPPYLKDIRKIGLPLVIKRILEDVANQPVNAIQISPTLTFELTKPLRISQERIEEIYNWLKGKPCGSKALYDYLTFKGQSPVGGVPAEQDIAVMALTIDIFNEVVKPEGNPSVIKNSLYALSKASEFFGHKLYPVKVEPQGQSLAAPFIAHLKGDHYVLVTKIAKDKVYVIDNHSEKILPKDKFLKEFTGYALVPKVTDPLTTISQTQARQVMGAGDELMGGSDNNYYYDNYATEINGGYPTESDTGGSIEGWVGAEAAADVEVPYWQTPEYLNAGLPDYAVNNVGTYANTAPASPSTLDVPYYQTPEYLNAGLPDYAVNNVGVNTMGSLSVADTAAINNYYTPGGSVMPGWVGAEATINSPVSTSASDWSTISGGAGSSGVINFGGVASGGYTGPTLSGVGYGDGLSTTNTLSGVPDYPSSISTTLGGYTGLSTGATVYSAGNTLSSAGSENLNPNTLSGAYPQTDPITITLGGYTGLSTGAYDTSTVYSGSNAYSNSLSGVNPGFPSDSTLQNPNAPLPTQPEPSIYGNGAGMSGYSSGIYPPAITQTYSSLSNPNDAPVSTLPVTDFYTTAFNDRNTWTVADISVPSAADTRNFSNPTFDTNTDFYLTDLAQRTAPTGDIRDFSPTTFTPNYGTSDIGLYPLQSDLTLATAPTGADNIGDFSGTNPWAWTVAGPDIPETIGPTITLIDAADLGSTLPPLSDNYFTVQPVIPIATFEPLPKTDEAFQTAPYLNLNSNNDSLDRLPTYFDTHFADQHPNIDWASGFQNIPNANNESRMNEFIFPEQFNPPAPNIIIDYAFVKPPEQLADLSQFAPLESPVPLQTGPAIYGGEEIVKAPPFLTGFTLGDNALEQVTANLPNLPREDEFSSNYLLSQGEAVLPPSGQIQSILNYSPAPVVQTPVVLASSQPLVPAGETEIPEPVGFIEPAGFIEPSGSGFIAGNGSLASIEAGTGLGSNGFSAGIDSGAYSIDNLNTGELLAAALKATFEAVGHQEYPAGIPESNSPIKTTPFDRALPPVAPPAPVNPPDSGPGPNPLPVSGSGTHQYAHANLAFLPREYMDLRVSQQEQVAYWDVREEVNRRTFTVLESHDPGPISMAAALAQAQVVAETSAQKIEANHPTLAESNPGLNTLPEPAPITSGDNLRLFVLEPPQATNPTVLSGFNNGKFLSNLVSQPHSSFPPVVKEFDAALLSGAPQPQNLRVLTPGEFPVQLKIMGVCHV